MWIIFFWLWWINNELITWIVRPDRLNLLCVETRQLEPSSHMETYQLVYLFNVEFWMLIFLKTMLIALGINKIDNKIWQSEPAISGDQTVRTLYTHGDLSVDSGGLQSYQLLFLKTRLIALGIIKVDNKTWQTEPAISGDQTFRTLYTHGDLSVVVLRQCL